MRSSCGSFGGLSMSMFRCKVVVALYSSVPVLMGCELVLWCWLLLYIGVPGCRSGSKWRCLIALRCVSVVLVRGRVSV